MSSKTLHIKLIPKGQKTVTLRYFFENQNDNTERDLKLDSIQNLLEKSESDYFDSSFTDLVEVGKELYNWFDGEDRFFETALKKAQGTTEIIILAISTEGNLAHIPWEIMHNGIIFLVQSHNPKIVPVRWKEQNFEPFEAENRFFKVLFMASSPDSENSVLSFEQEEAMILEATKEQPLFLKVEESGNLEELSKLISSYGNDSFDVFHFTGHAGAGENGIPIFVTEDEFGGEKHSTAEDIFNALRRKPKLIFLSGCETAKSQKKGSIPSLVEKLLELGAKNVLGWAKSVYDKDATLAATTFYKNLSEGFEIAEALSETYRKLIEEKARHWHLLRFYLAGEMQGSLVTPLNSANREPIPIRKIEKAFLDEEKNVRVPTRESFVGRRRPLQRCLRELKKIQTDKIGVFLHGMGGIGKSSVASRLCNRLDEFKTIVWAGKIDEFALNNKLVDKIEDKNLRDILQNPNDDLKFKLKTVFSKLPQKKFLLVLDDFEQNAEKNLRQGLPVLRLDAKKVLEALDFAISETNYQNRVIVTCRYEFKVKEEKSFYKEHLHSFGKADLKKKIEQLERTLKKTPDEKVIGKIIEVADGNPRLLEWVFKILEKEELDLSKIFEKLLEKEAEFRENILAEELLNQQTSEFRKTLALVSLFKIPVPRIVVEEVCKEEVNGFEKHLERAIALGLLEKWVIPKGENHYRVSQIILQFLESEKPKNFQEILKRACHFLYKIWNKSPNFNETKAMEIWRLALETMEKEIGFEMLERITGNWNKFGYFNETIKFCKETKCKIGEDYRLLNRLGYARYGLGHSLDSKDILKKALKNCPSNSPLYKAEIFSNIGKVLEFNGDFEEAISFMEKAGDIFGEKREKFGEAIILNDKGVAFAALGKKEEAKLSLKKSIELKNKIGLEDENSPSYHQLGEISFDEDDFNLALEYAEKSFEISYRTKNQSNKSHSLHLKAKIYEAKGEIEKALNCANECRQINVDLQNVLGIASIDILIGQIYIGNLKEYKKGIEILNNAVRYLKKVKPFEKENLSKIFIKNFQIALENLLSENDFLICEKAIKSGDLNKFIKVARAYLPFLTQF